ncbi:hypothetical protein [Celeribacter arenosi]|uniref:Uncharacterized protein n=1 Tax=Celeribacter arenosi TaxID=792649 RepID=A0ABP7JYQ0_9RHOB
MHRTYKSATCCYCGNKTVLDLGGKTRHELKCAACAAPLSRMKSLRVDHVEDAFTIGGKKGHKARQPKRKPRPHKKRERGFAYYLGEFIEEVLDVFD